MAILPGISGPQDVKRLDAKQLDELAAELRQLTASRKQTPSELLQREGRDER